jgi:Bacterial PH domain
VTSPAGPAYQARYGRTPKHIIGMSYGFAMSAMILLIPAPAWARVIVVGTLGGVGVMLATMTFSRNPALRVDAAGVTIRPYTLNYSVIAFYPWEDVVQIRISRSRQTNAQYVEIKLREGAMLSALSRLTRQRKRDAMAVASAGLAVNGWTLHPARLAAAVARFAPAVQVIDATTGFVVDPERHDVRDGTGQLPRQVRPAHGWPGWVFAGAGAGLVSGVILAVVGGPADAAASTAAGFLILLALAAVCVATPASLYRRYRARRGT